jgi:hypothetical protein
MFGYRFIKIPPTSQVMVFKGGAIVRAGAGLAFFYFAPTTSLVVVPLQTVDVPFMFSEVSADFQEVTVQGQVAYRIAEPGVIARVLDYTIDGAGRYRADDPEKVPQRILNVLQVLVHRELARLPLRAAVGAADAVAAAVAPGLAAAPELRALGLEVLGVSVLAIRPTPETARALEAEAREQLLRDADGAIHARRVAAVEQERVIREKELGTEIAVEHKKREIREAQMEAERVVQEKQHQLQQAEVLARTAQEEQRQALVALAVANSRAEADAKAYAVTGMMKALSGVDARTLQALSSVGMQPDQLIAVAFQGLAERADRIGELNISPDLLRGLLEPRTPGPARQWTGTVKGG